MGRIDHVTKPEEVGKRVDALLSERYPEVSRSRLRQSVVDGAITVNGLPAKPAWRVKEGDRVEGEVAPAPRFSAAPEEITLEVVYQDRDLAVIDKPAGLVVHPAPGHESGTLANALAALFPETAGIGEEMRPGIVHRLDKDTSGLMVVALSPGAHASLQQQLARRTAGREYIALVDGHPRPARGIIDAPIGRDPADRKRMSTYGVAARPARTAYSVEEEIGDRSLLRAKLQSGRTHQIRVHMAATGHPVAGDTTYGGRPAPGLHRQFLHAVRLTLISPSDGRELTFQSTLPPDLASVLDELRAESAASQRG